jgi:thioredoxin-related protein
MIDRRRLILAGTAAALLPGAALHPGTAQAAPELDESGLYQLPWFLDSFLDLGEDLTAATREGKRFVILWGLKGCPYCKELHTVNFATPEIETYVRENFVLLHLNHIGAREVTDFDGAKLGEKVFGEKYGIRFTPSLQFFPETADGLAGKPPLAREVARVPGYMKPEPFLAMFRFVREKGYEAGSFQDWLKKRGA